FNPERVVMDDALVSIPAANVGDIYAGAVQGVLSYNFGNYFLLPTASPTRYDGGLGRESTRGPDRNDVAVATFNLAPLAPTDPHTKLARLGAITVHNPAAPGLLALEESQGSSGATDDGTVAADQTFGKLVAAITAAGGPAYEWREIDPINDSDG